MLLWWCYDMDTLIALTLCAGNPPVTYKCCSNKWNLALTFSTSLNKLLNKQLLVILRHLNTLRPRQEGGHFPDDVFKCIFLNENVWISIKISLRFVPKGPINNIPALIQIMAWRRPGAKPLSEPMAMMVELPTHICVTRPQWVNCWCLGAHCNHIGLGYNETIFRYNIVSSLGSGTCVIPCVICGA